MCRSTVRTLRNRSSAISRLVRPPRAAQHVQFPRGQAVRVADRDGRSGEACASAAARARAGCAPSGVQMARASSRAHAPPCVVARRRVQRREREQGEGALVGGGAGIGEGEGGVQVGARHRHSGPPRCRVRRAGGGRRGGRGAGAARWHGRGRARRARGPALSPAADNTAPRACPSDWPSTAPLHASQRSCASSHAFAVGDRPRQAPARRRAAAAVSVAEVAVPGCGPGPGRQRLADSRPCLLCVALHVRQAAESCRERAASGRARCMRPPRRPLGFFPLPLEQEERQAVRRGVMTLPPVVSLARIRVSAPVHRDARRPARSSV